MSVHILLDTTFFRTSVSISAQQRLLPIPANRGLNEGDTIFLRDESGALTWVTDVLMTGEVHGVGAWSGADEPPGRYAITGFLARIHPGILPPGKSRLQSPWVTLNSRTLENALPWWETHVLLYHSTLHLIEGLLTLEEVQKGLKEQCLVQHTSGHIIVPHGEARKRLLVHVQGHELVCALCGGPIASIEDATQDHIIPLSQGGPDALANIALTHRACNELKGNALPEQYPPMFPVPGNGGAWRPAAFRKGRHVHSRGRRSTPKRSPVPELTLPLRGTGAIVGHDEPEAVDAAAVHSEGTAQTSKRTDTRRASAKAKTEGNEAKKAHGRNEGAEERADQAAQAEQAKQSETQSRDKADASKTERSGLVEVDQAWLDRIQKCKWSELMEYAGERDWAAKTASLRTLEQLPRSNIKEATAAGRPIIEAEGQKGRFRLLEWGDNIVLIEERGQRQSYFLVRQIKAISWETYVWYLTRFGRTTPLAAAMSLLPLWRQGKPDAEGRIHVSKTGIPIIMSLQEDQLYVVEAEQTTDVA